MEIQLYVLLMYCVGACSAEYAPNGLLMFTSLESCKQHMLPSHISRTDGKPAGFDLVEHCAKAYVGDPRDQFYLKRK